MSMNKKNGVEIQVASKKFCNEIPTGFFQSSLTIIIINGAICISFPKAA